MSKMQRTSDNRRAFGRDRRYPSTNVVYGPG